MELGEKVPLSQEEAQLKWKFQLLSVSHYFGFGLMDAAMMVRLARSWKTVPPQHKCVGHYSERYRYCLIFCVFKIIHNDFFLFF